MKPIFQSNMLYFVVQLRRLDQVIRCRETIIAFAFIVSLGVFEHNLLNTGFIRYITDLSFSGLPIWARVIMLNGHFVLAYLYVWVSCFSSWGVRCVSFTIFTIAVFIEYGYAMAYGRFIEITDIKIAMGATLENYHDAILSYFNWLSLISVAAYALLLLTTSNAKRVGFRSFSIVVSVMLLVIMVGLRHSLVDPPALSITSFFRAAIIFPSTIDWPWILKFAAHRDTLSFHASILPQNNIVLIIDESYRSDHLSINGYKRDTTPFLTELVNSGNIYNWGTASAAGTYSDVSNPILLTGVSDLPDTAYRTRLNPSIFQYAKAMGYTTFYYSGQTSKMPYEFSNDDMAYIDNFITTQDMALNFEIDFEIAMRVRQFLNSAVGQFIVIQKRGIHFDYDRQYPSKADKWQPVLKSGRVDPAHRTELVNSYDNALHYNCETFFRTLLNQRDFLDTTTIVYTSDHGETLADSGENYFHGGRSKSEASVPLFIITRKKLPVNTNYRASHFNVFPTLLDLMNFPISERKYKYDQSLLGTTAAEAERQRYCFSGALHGSTFGTYSEWGKAAVFSFD